MMSDNIVTLYPCNARDVVSMLRKAADDIERGEYAEPVRMVAVLECEDGDVTHFGCGDCDERDAYMLMSMAREALMRELMG